MKTPKDIILIEMPPGHYFHFGLKDGLYIIIPQCPTVKKVILQINIDGVPIYSSSSFSFWPILCRVTNINNSVFIVGLYGGHGKPADVQQYMQPLVDELVNVLANGIIFSNTFLKVELESILCDAPAKAFVKCIKLYSGYYGCDSCSQKGVYNGRMTYPENNSPLRTNISFRQRYNDEHHLGTSPFEVLEIDMIKCFPHDYLHVVCMGIVKKLLTNLSAAPIPFKTSALSFNNMSANLCSLQAHITHDFARKPRSFQYLAKWKATEFRLFILYLCPVILFQSVHPRIYSLFLTLHCIMCILTHPNLYKHYNDYCINLACYFVNECACIWGDSFIVYNIHSLIHLVQDTLTHGLIDKFSCFWAENFLHFIKILPKGSRFPMKQAVNRIMETDVCLGKLRPLPKKQSKRVPFVDSSYGINFQYFVSKLYSNDKQCYVSMHQPDCYVLLHNKKILQIMHIGYNNENVCHLIGTVFKDYDSIYNSPLNSTMLNVFFVKTLGQKIVVTADLILCKMMLLPFKNGFCALPLNHTLQDDSMGLTSYFM
jgi:hypothetical protein